MTRLFIRFYVGVLIVLLLAWYIHGDVSERFFGAERIRVAEKAHGGGIRLVVSELDAAPIAEREEVVKRLRGAYFYPIAEVS